MERLQVFFPDRLKQLLPPLYSQDGKPKNEVKVPVKFFDSCSQWTWYATEFDGKDRFFGYVKGFENEFGYFSLSELESIKNGLGLPLERDEWWNSDTTLDQVVK